MLQSHGAQRARRYRYLVCAIIFSGYILVYFHRLCPAVIALDMQEAFNVSGTLLGVLGSAYFYAYAVMQLPTGLLADSWGPRNTVASFLVVAAVGSVLMGASPSLGGAILGRVLVGFGVATLYVCNYKLLSEWFEPREFVIMGGIFMIMGGMGALFSSAPLAWVSKLIGWRMALVSVGIVTLVMAALVYGFVRNRPEDKGWPPVHGCQEQEEKMKVSLAHGIRQVITTKRYWSLCVWGFSATGLYFAVAALWGGPYLMHVYGLSKVAAGGILSTWAVGLIVGSPALSVASNRLGRKTVLIGCSLILVGVCGLFWLFTDRLSLPMLYILFLGLAIFGGASGPMQAALAKELFPVGIAGTAVGIQNVFPFLGGAVLQVLIGAVVSHGGHDQAVYTSAGYQHMFLLCVVSALVSLVAAILLQETLPGRKKDRADHKGRRTRNEGGRGHGRYEG